MSETTQGEGENLEFTTEAEEKYVENPDHCPFCNADTLSVVPAHDQDFDGTHFENKMMCTQCNKKWWETYELAAITPVGKDD